MHAENVRLGPGWVQYASGSTLKVINDLESTLSTGVLLRKENRANRC